MVSKNPGVRLFQSYVKNSGFSSCRFLRVTSLRQFWSSQKWMIYISDLFYLAHNFLKFNSKGSEVLVTIACIVSAESYSNKRCNCRQKEIQQHIVFFWGVSPLSVPLWLLYQTKAVVPVMIIWFDCWKQLRLAILLFVSLPPLPPKKAYFKKSWCSWSNAVACGTVFLSADSRVKFPWFEAGTPKTIFFLVDLFFSFCC